MPLIVKADASFGASYNSSLPREINTHSPSSEPTETTPILTKSTQDRHNFARKLRRKLKMRRFPIACLILAEVCERFAYYGIVINFVLFLDNFGWSMFASAGGVLVYTSIAWFMCTLGGILADSRFGRYSTIVSGLVVYFIGSILLVGVAVWLDYRKQLGDASTNLPILPWLVLIMLAIACGEGAVKANLSAFSAEQFQGDSPSGTWKGLFNCFYWLSNVVALLGLVAVTYIQQTKLFWTYGYTMGFVIPLICLTVADVAFLASSKQYVIEGPHGTGLRNVKMIIKQAWNKRNDKIETRELSAFSLSNKVTWLDRASVQYGGTFLNSEVYEVKALGKAFVFSLCLIPYWMIYSQLYTTFILQGLHLSAMFGGLMVPAAWLSLLEIAVVLVLVPVMERVAYPFCAKWGVYVPRLWKVAFGIVLAVASVGMAGFVETKKVDYFELNGYVNQTTSCKVYPAVSGFTILWQVPQYVLLGASEVFASMSGLEVVYSLCSTTPQSVTSGLYNIMIGVGSLLSFVTMAIVTNFHWYPSHIESDLVYLQKRKVALFYWLLGGIALLGVVLLVIVGYCFDIGISRTNHHHHLFVNEEDEAITPPSTYTISSEGDASPAERNDRFEAI